MKIIRLVFISFLIVASALNIYGNKKKNYTYVGAKVCKKCHETGAGNIYNQWAGSIHAKAQKNLESDKAVEIGAAAGITKPATDRKCLMCHNTGFGKVEELIGEGVGCEVCHGPASGYVGYSAHASKATKKDNYDEALKHGMYPVLGDDHITHREKLCRHCHKKERPCYKPANMSEAKKIELPLSVIANFRHEIH